MSLTLDEVLCLCDTFTDGVTPPHSWENAMQALVAGVMEDHEVEEFALACAAVADDLLLDAAPDGPNSLISTWSHCAQERLETLIEFQQSEAFDTESPICAWFVRMGAVADRA